MVVLNDGRLLIYSDFSNFSEKKKNKFCIYNIKKDILCNIDYDIVEKIYDILQIDKDKIIVLFEENNHCDDRGIKLYKIKEKSIELVKRFEIKYAKKIYKISKNAILTNIIGNYVLNMQINIYENEDLKINEKFTIDNIQVSRDLCVIKDNEIVVYYWKNAIIGENAFLLFYDIKNKKEIKRLKLGDFKNKNDYKDGNRMLLFDNNIIVELNDKLIMIDIKSKNIRQEIKSEWFFEPFILLNKRAFLIVSDNYIYQYKLNEKTNKIELEEKNKKFLKNIVKYPENKIIIIKEGRGFDFDIGEEEKENIIISEVMDY